MAAGVFYGVQKDFLFSRSVKALPGPQLAGRIQEAYETIKKVPSTIFALHGCCLTSLDRTRRTSDVLHIVGSY
jgi:hypothetical protein